MCGLNPVVKTLEVRFQNLLTIPTMCVFLIRFVLTVYSNNESNCSKHGIRDGVLANERRVVISNSIPSHLPVYRRQRDASSLLSDSRRTSYLRLQSHLPTLHEGERHGNMRWVVHLKLKVDRFKSSSTYMSHE